MINCGNSNDVRNDSSPSQIGFSQQCVIRWREGSNIDFATVVLALPLVIFQEFNATLMLPINPHSIADMIKIQCACIM
ncbi:unnamed protein product [Ceratitis capitata]|uniref:(Mediterranean fruit fly) hypothetical protein n=1 Tax=Ceratitis capitata TaxID=7213 RepID=A0A811URU5_CERCA|nr:unnamed protein product [Ceratitis capitata]